MWKQKEVRRWGKNRWEGLKIEGCEDEFRPPPEAERHCLLRLHNTWKLETNRNLRGGSTLRGFAIILKCHSYSDALLIDWYRSTSGSLKVRPTENILKLVVISPIITTILLKLIRQTPSVAMMRSPKHLLKQLSVSIGWELMSLCKKNVKNVTCQILRQKISFLEKRFQ